MIEIPQDTVHDILFLKKMLESYCEKEDVTPLVTDQGKHAFVVKCKCPKCTAFMEVFPPCFYSTPIAAAKHFVLNQWEFSDIWEVMQDKEHKFH